VRSRSFVLVLIMIVGLGGLAGGLLAYDSGQREEIANGVHVGGVDIGGLSSSQARARLRAAFAGRIERPIVASYHARRFALHPQAARVSIDIAGSVAEALQQSRAADLFTRTWRSLTGGSLNVTVDPQVEYSHAAVAAFVRGVTRALDRPVREARISYSADSIGAVRASPGLTVDTASMTAAIERALASPAAGREIPIPAGRIAPRTSTAQLAARYPTIITIDRASFKLRLWKHLRLVQAYTIAVGMAGLATPAGLYHVQDKEVDPSWHVPNSAWAGALAGRTIPPGPADPLKARWLGIFNGAGIHGTDELGSLGTAASHGCIRMAIPDVIALYDQTPLGAPVYIA
jgi:lipoprotein-anchoring transpeptidase ErfK/SrfK